MDISFLTALNQEKADENDLHNIVKISDCQTRAFALIAYGNDAMNRGDFTVAIDAFLHAGNCSEYGSAAYLKARRKIAKLFDVLNRPDCGIAYVKEVEDYYSSHVDTESYQLIDRSHNLCLYCDLELKIGNLSKAEELMWLIDKLRPNEKNSMHIIATKIRYFENFNDYDRQKEFLTLYLNKVRSKMEGTTKVQLANAMCTFLLIHGHIEEGKALLALLKDVVLTSNENNYEILYLNNQILLDSILDDKDQRVQDILKFHDLMEQEIIKRIHISYRDVEFRIEADQLRASREKMYQENQRLIWQAKTDALTGLPNRRALSEHMEHFLKMAREEQKNVGFEFIDIDYFKQLNDTYGHQKGDEALQALATCLNKISSDRIFVSRYGGDEFCVIYYDMKAEEILSVVENIKKRIEDLKFLNINSKVSDYLSVSQGVFLTTPQEDTRIWDLMHRADQVLYRVKKETRGNYLMEEKQCKRYE